MVSEKLGLAMHENRVIRRASAVLQRADEEYELLAAPDGTVAIEMNLLRALIALAAQSPEQGE